ncbi:unnamed protein product [Schistosoma curassoni]|uniref:Secreted protein n=1 Tax=Schistosoma curassoni TaxID=6186 RepID=A0A183L682_9TREM|nr:unnamed protein product [Schistosoma curassoni]
MWRIFAVTATSASSASAGMLSGFVALPLLIFLMATPISSMVGGSKLIARSMGAALMLGGFRGVLYSSVSLFFNVDDYFAFLTFTGRSGLR